MQSLVDARRQVDENQDYGLVAETMKLLVKISCGYQKLGRSRHTVTRYFNNDKTHSAPKSKFSRKLDHAEHQLYDAELPKAEIEHKEPVAIGFFPTKSKTTDVCALLEFSWKNFAMEMYTASLHNALAEKN